MRQNLICCGGKVLLGVLLVLALRLVTSQGGAASYERLRVGCK